jgi:hypothetical protein
MPKQENKMTTKDKCSTDSMIDFVIALATVRMDWEQAELQESLIEAQASVGLILADIARAADLTPEQELFALGPKLFGDISQYTEAVE